VDTPWAPPTPALPTRTRSRTKGPNTLQAEPGSLTGTGRRSPDPGAAVNQRSFESGFRTLKGRRRISLGTSPYFDGQEGRQWTSMKETQWVLRAIILVGFAVSVTLAHVPGAKEAGQGEDFNGLLGTVAGILVLGAMLFGAIRGERAAWLVVFGLVTLRTLWEIGVAIEEPSRALGWASAGSWVVVALAAWGLRPANAFTRHSASSDTDDKDRQQAPG
jgi:hypothetical protein